MVTLPRNLSGAMPGPGPRPGAECGSAHSSHGKRRCRWPARQSRTALSASGSARDSPKDSGKQSGLPRTSLRPPARQFVVPIAARLHQRLLPCGAASWWFRRRLSWGRAAPRRAGIAPALPGRRQRRAPPRGVVGHRRSRKRRCPQPFPRRRQGAR
eukprot:scaffold1220_cov259-Pinguiococcus_pyrenoidosus.AAC.65